MKRTVRTILGDNAYARLSRWVRNSPSTPPTAEDKAAAVKKKSFYGSFVRKGDLCFDVGANIGNRVEAFLDVGARVVAVEPQEFCYKILRKKYGRKINIVTKGLGEKKGSKEFYISDAHTISSFSKEFIDLFKNGRFKSYQWNEPIVVEITTLDILIKDYGKPHFIKIDVEGYELEVLKGLSIPVRMISFEYAVPEQTAKVSQCIEQIQQINPDIECNFSIGESMEFALNEWISVAEMKQYIADDYFNSTVFGDVYCRTKN